MSMPTTQEPQVSICLRLSHIIGQPNGIHILSNALAIAERCARCEIETSCTRVEHPTDGDYWDTSTGLFEGPCENDVEFRQMRDQELQLLKDLGMVEVHPKRAHWVRFKNNMDITLSITTQISPD
jgi:hypothetical protein